MDGDTDGRLDPFSRVSSRTTNVSTSDPLGTRPLTATVTWMLLEALAMETAAVPPQAPWVQVVAELAGTKRALSNSVDKAL